MKSEPTQPTVPVAHLSEDGNFHTLEDHLKAVGVITEKFAGVFGSAEWGRTAGLWHDVGKYSSDFQEYLLAIANGKKLIHHVDHSTAGALYAEKRLGPHGRILSYSIAGHHAGLPDWQTENSGYSGLAQRLQRHELLERVDLQAVPTEITTPSHPMQKPPIGCDLALWIRMLYSCLVDADFLDTEAFMNPDKASLRARYPTIAELLAKFESFMEEKSLSAKNTPINHLRKEILERCQSAASLPCGIFTLTVPTGGGKTLSSMAFALKHAVCHGLQRIIYVIPYTSIIEQTADQFRQIFGETVIEHHSNLEVPNINNEEFERSQLASENWDAPIVVTTSVQFFESLFASRSSRCRKLHNIVNSVVVLDEAQLLPPEFLTPILRALQELNKTYGVTLLLCTATQPAFRSQKAIDFEFMGLDNTVEIMSDPETLHQAFKRVEVILPVNLKETIVWEKLADELAEHPTVLCVVNRRDDCRQIHSLMPAGTIHLSALMCGAHRVETIKNIKKRLAEGIPTRVVSTQLVEAGVDLDFPVVYRAMAGLDSIAQAAGRCNREGNLELGKVIVFVPPSLPPPGHLRQVAGIGARLLSQGVEDPLSPNRFTEFFREVYWLKGNQGLDAKGIMDDLAYDAQLRISFRTAANKFRIIDDSRQASVIVRYGDGNKLIAQLKKTGPERWLMRRFQRYVVSLPKYIHQRLVAEDSISEPFPGIFVQENGNMYDQELGFCIDRSLIYEPDDLII